MSSNRFEDSRISEGTLRRGAQHDGTLARESRSVSRDDVRDGFAARRRSSKAAEAKRAAPRNKRGGASPPTSTKRPG